jgi:hypothetical protein
MHNYVRHTHTGRVCAPRSQIAPRDSNNLPSPPPTQSGQVLTIACKRKTNNKSHVKRESTASRAGAGHLGGDGLDAKLSFQWGFGRAIDRRGGGRCGGSLVGVRLRILFPTCMIQARFDSRRSVGESLWGGGGLLG